MNDYPLDYEPCEHDHDEECCDEEAAGAAMSEVIIVKAVETCPACPSQWDAWDLDGNYWYLRYRHSRGTAERQPSPDIDTWSNRPPNISFEAQDGDTDGWIDLETFCQRAGLNLSLMESPLSAERYGQCAGC